MPVKVVTTVRIVNSDDLGNYKTINIEDYDASTDTLWGENTKLPIVSGVVTIPQTGDGEYTIETEGAASTDNVTQITGLSVGDEIIIRPANGTHTVVLKNGTYLKLGADISLDHEYDSVTLKCVATGTCMIKGGIFNAG